MVFLKFAHTSLVYESADSFRKAGWGATTMKYIEPISAEQNSVSAGHETFCNTIGFLVLLAGVPIAWYFIMVLFIQALMSSGATITYL
jgi:hypothetical protein